MSTTPSTDTPDALALLAADHAQVKSLFDDFKALAEKAEEDDAIEDIARTICAMLTTHTSIEEEILYPAAREALDDEDLLDEAQVEHDTAKELIGLIESDGLESDLFVARVKVLGEYVEHHVKEEEEALFPKLRKTSLDLRALGRQLKARKDELMPELAEHRDVE
ncbi:MAG: hemerythrin domain-containing protein [Lautropia sp.]